MRIGYKINGIFLVLVLGLVLNTSTASGKLVPTGDQVSSKTLRSMARIYMAYGQYGKAQPLAEQALSLAKRNEVSDCELAMCFIDLATLYTYEGKLGDAEEMCQSGLQLQKKILYKNHPYLAYTLRTLSSIYYEQGEYRKAKSALDEAVVIMLDSHDSDDQAMAPFFVDMANILVAQSELEQAESYYQKAMLLINTSYGPNHLYTANVLADIAKLYIMQEKYAAAEKLIDQAIAVQEKIYGRDHYLIAASWLTKAKVCQVTGKTAQAEDLINKALTAAEKTGDAATLPKLEQRAAEIRTIRQVAYGPVAKADK